MNNADRAYVTVGKMGSSYGVRGWIKVYSYTECGTAILDYTPWYLLQKNDDWNVIEVESGKAHGNGLIVKLAGINTPEEACLLTGKKIAVARSHLPALQKNEYYWSDLEGLTVINQHKEVLGKVIYLMETGSNDVLVIKRDKEHAIPYLPGRVIKHIDLKKQEIHVEWELI